MGFRAFLQNFSIFMSWKKSVNFFDSVVVFYCLTEAGGTI